MKFNIKNNINNISDINLRDEMEDLLKRWGYPILVVYATDISCDCLDNNKVAGKCTKCLGLNKKIDLYKITAIRIPSSQRITFPNSKSLGQFGNVYSNAMTFYFKWYRDISVGSQIYEVSWKKDIPDTIISMYDIEYSEPYRMDNGRIEYRVASGNRNIIDLYIKQQAIRNMEVKVIDI